MDETAPARAFDWGTLESEQHRSRSMLRHRLRSMLRQGLHSMLRHRLHSMLRQARMVERSAKAPRRNLKRQPLGWPPQWRLH